MAENRLIEVYKHCMSSNGSMYDPSNDEVKKISELETILKQGTDMARGHDVFHEVAVDFLSLDDGHKQFSEFTEQSFQIYLTKEAEKLLGNVKDVSSEDDVADKFQTAFRERLECIYDSIRTLLPEGSEDQQASPFLGYRMLIVPSVIHQYVNTITQIIIAQKKYNLLPYLREIYSREVQIIDEQQQNLEPYKHKALLHGMPSDREIIMSYLSNLTAIMKDPDDCWKIVHDPDKMLAFTVLGLDFIMKEGSVWQSLKEEQLNPINALKQETNKIKDRLKEYFRVSALPPDTSELIGGLYFMQQARHQGNKLLQSENHDNAVYHALSFIRYFGQSIPGMKNYFHNAFFYLTHKQDFGFEEEMKNKGTVECTDLFHIQVMEKAYNTLTKQIEKPAINFLQDTQQLVQCAMSLKELQSMASQFVHYYHLFMQEHRDNDSEKAKHVFIEYNRSIEEIINRIIQPFHENYGILADKFFRNRYYIPKEQSYESIVDAIKAGNDIAVRKMLEDSFNSESDLDKLDALRTTYAECVGTYTQQRKILEDVLQKKTAKVINDPTSENIRVQKDVQKKISILTAVIPLFKEYSTYEG